MIPPEKPCQTGRSKTCRSFFNTYYGRIFKPPIFHHFSAAIHNGSGLRADSPPGNDYWHPDYDETSGAMVCHGPGPVEETEILGHPWLRQGPLLPPGYPITKQIYDHEVALYATRNLFEVSPHPSRPEIALSDWQGYAEDSGQSLLLANMQGNDPQEIIGISDALSSTNRFFGIRWSKEAKRITYTLGPFFGGPKAAADVWTIRPDGSQTLNLTDNPKSNDGMADFSSDGEWLVFRSGRDGTFNLHWMRADGTGLRPLTDNRWQENHAAVSPTANRVAFVSNRDGVPYPIPNYGENDEPESAGGDEGQYDSKDEHYLTTDIYMLHLTEKGKIKKRVRITNSPGHDAHPRFSPDGKWLIFASERGGINDEEPLIQEIMFEPQMYGDLYARRLADGVTIRLTHDKWENGAPFWVGPARPERDPRTSDSGSVQ